MNTKLLLRDWYLVLQWALLGTYGTMLGLPIALSISMVWTLLRDDVLHLTISPSVIDLSYVIIIASTTGVFLGTLQVRVLKLQNMHTRWWIAASTIGLSMGAACISILANQSRLFETTHNYLSVGGMLGFVLGIAQWLVLRLQLANSSWWIAGSLVGGVLSSVIVRPLVVLSNAIDSPLIFLVFLFFFGFAVGIIYMTITGINLSWLLRNPVHAPQKAG
jgi:hypothetical protein